MSRTENSPGKEPSALKKLHKYLMPFTDAVNRIRPRRMIHNMDVGFDVGSRKTF